MKWRNFRFLKPGAWGLSFAVFSGTIILGGVLQFYLLPQIFPSLHWGHGLLYGGDWCGFHQEAVRVAYAIETQGWQAWEPWPSGNWPAGAAAALYAFTGIQEPWVMLPVNGLLHALGVTLFFILMRRLTGRPLVALLSTAPYLFFPSGAMIWGQIHKDIWTIPAALLVMLSWVTLAESERMTVTTVFGAWLSTLIALSALILVRPYAVKLLFAGSLAAFLYLIGRALWRKLLHRTMLSRTTLAGTLGIIAIFLLAIYFPLERPNIIVFPSGESYFGTESDHVWLHIINQPARTIESLRQGFFTTYPYAFYVDKEARFQNLLDVILYLPRALQIGLLAPWPDMWFGPAASPGGEWMRRVSAMEMSVAYLLLPGIIMILWRGSPAMRTLVLFCIVIVIIQTLAIPNVGTLYRMRYIFFHVLLGLGIVGYGLVSCPYRLRRSLDFVTIWPQS